jgi:hypothetical protein
MSPHPKSGQNQNVRIADETFEKVAKFKRMGTMLPNHNDIYEEIKSKIFFLPVSKQKNLKIKIYKIVIL